MVVRVVTLLILAAWIGVLIFPWISATQAFRVHVFNVGQGTSALVVTRSGHTLLYDTGPSRFVTSELGSHLPPWKHSIDIMALSHNHADHVTGASFIATHYSIGAVWLGSPPPTQGNAYPELRRALIDIPISAITVIQRNSIHTLGSATIYATTPKQCDVVPREDQVHNCTLLLRVEDGEHSVLLTGDLDQIQTNSITREKPQILDTPSTILLVSHHGAAGGTSAALLTYAQPHYALISVGKDNIYHHPHASTLQLLNDFEVLRTDIHGTITIECQVYCQEHHQARPP